eukprot:evm.model.scf_35.7 EVM.evm.TU.scf_35.7   scf_35:60076-61904(+)
MLSSTFRGLTTMNGALLKHGWGLVRISRGDLRCRHRPRKPGFPAFSCSEGADPINAPPPFHLAFPVRDISESRQFYGRLLGCPEGRSAKTWVDFNLYGHQIVTHLVKEYDAASTANSVDGDPVPVPHFGLALTTEQFQQLADRVRSAGVKFEIEPHLRFKGAPGEQWTMFFRDPSGNALEFKAMTNPENLFAKYAVDS